jgi:transposase
MAANSSTRRNGTYWKSRRKKAEQMFSTGVRQSTVARLLGISRQCIHNWFWQWQAGDGSPQERLRRTGAGRRSKLDRDKMAEVDAALRRGPRYFGFAGERWTLWRVASVIERITGIQYHPSSIWRILRSLGWTLRLPTSKDGQPRGAYIPREWTAPARSKIPKA